MDVTAIFIVWPKPQSHFYIFSYNGCSILNLSSIGIWLLRKICSNTLIVDQQVWSSTQGQGWPLTFQPRSWLKGQRLSLTLSTLTISSKYNGFGFNSNWPSPLLLPFWFGRRRLFKGFTINNVWAWPPSCINFGFPTLKSLHMKFDFIGSNVFWENML